MGRDPIGLDLLRQERLDLPAGWITAMNHMFHTAQRVAVRSVAARYAGSWQARAPVFRGVLEGECYFVLCVF